MCLYICIQPYICNFIYIIPLKFSKERIRLAKSMFMTENKKYIDIALNVDLTVFLPLTAPSKSKGISPREFKNAMIKSL